MELTANPLLTTEDIFALIPQGFIDWYSANSHNEELMQMFEADDYKEKFQAQIESLWAHINLEMPLEIRGQNRQAIRALLWSQIKTWGPIKTKDRHNTTNPLFKALLKATGNDFKDFIDNIKDLNLPFETMQMIWHPTLTLNAHQRTQLFLAALTIETPWREEDFRTMGTQNLSSQETSNNLGSLFEALHKNWITFANDTISQTLIPKTWETILTKILNPQLSIQFLITLYPTALELRTLDSNLNGFNLYKVICNTIATAPQNPMYEISNHFLARIITCCVQQDKNGDKISDYLHDRTKITVECFEKYFAHKLSNISQPNSRASTPKIFANTEQIAKPSPQKPASSWWSISSVFYRTSSPKLPSHPSTPVPTETSEYLHEDVPEHPGFDSIASNDRLYT